MSGSRSTLDLRALIAARDAGVVRCTLLAGDSHDLVVALTRLGLRPDASGLSEHGHDDALAILIGLLWKDQAYRAECMPRSQAEDFARRLFDDHARPDSKYYSNRVGSCKDQWHPFTDATFDAGLIIANDDHSYFCIWIEDED